MKKIAKIFGVIIVLVLLAMIIVPYFFKDKLIGLIQDEANKQLNATLYFEDADLTFFAHFPNLTLKIENLTLTGQEEFEDIQLVSFQRFDLVVGLGKVIQGEMPDIKKVYLDQPVVNALVLSNGKVNWDIVKESESPEESTDIVAADKTTEADDFNLALNYYEIKNAMIIYEDREGKMLLVIKGLDHSGGGNLGASGLSLITKTTLSHLLVEMEGEKYMDGLSLKADLDFNVDIESMRFDLTRSDIRLHTLALLAEGYFAMPADDIEMDIRFKSPASGLKQLLALAPESYTGDLEAYEFSGDVGFSGWIKGVYNDNQMPLFGIDINVSDGAFHYAELPESVTDIQIETHIELKDSKELNSLVVDVNPFNLKLGQNPVEATFNLINPMTTMDVNSYLKARIDLASLKKVMPLEAEDQLKGIIQGDLSFSGSLSDAESENYEKLKADGFMAVKDILYKAPNLSKSVVIDSSRLEFNLDKATLKYFHATIGESDFELRGQLTDFIPYALSDQTLNGRLNYHSNHLNLDEIMVLYLTEEHDDGDEKGGETIDSPVASKPTTGADTKEQETKVDETTSKDSEPSSDTTVEVRPQISKETNPEEELLIPKNIDFVLTASVDNIIYEKVILTDFKGNMKIKDGVVRLENCMAKTLGGQAVINGSFLELKPGTSLVDFDFKLKNMEISETAEKVEMVRTYAPIAMYTKGHFSTQMTFKSHLDNEFNPIYNTVYSKGILRTDKVHIEGYKPLDKLASVTKTSDIIHQTFDNLNIEYEIIDGKAFIKPFDFKVDQLTGNTFGSIDLDQNLDFLIHMSIPTAAMGDEANQLMGQFAGALAGYGVNVDVPKTIEMDVEVTGKSDNPKFKPSVSGVSSEEVKDVVKEKVKEEFDKAKEDATKRAKEEADKIMKDAQKKADKLMAEARKNGKMIKDEAYKQADDLVKNAGDPFSKMGAEVAAKELKKQADKQVDNLLNEAQKQADKILSDAQKQADRIK